MSKPKEPPTIILTMTVEEGRALQRLIEHDSTTWHGLCHHVGVRDPKRLPDELAQKHREAMERAR